MARKELIVALGLIVAASPLTAASAQAPAAPPGARYCLRVDPIIGTRIETIQCRTRDDWASLDVNVDQEWRENGVKVLA
jgi:hypothetical protein